MCALKRIDLYRLNINETHSFLNTSIVSKHACPLSNFQYTSFFDVLYQNQKHTYYNFMCSATIFSVIAYQLRVKRTRYTCIKSTILLRRIQFLKKREKQKKFTFLKVKQIRCLTRYIAFFRSIDICVIGTFWKI